MICTDKTGTLTQNRMEVRSIYVADAFVDPRAARNAGVRRRAPPVPRMRRALPRPEGRRRNGTTRAWIGDPMELALVRIAETALADDAACSSASTRFPFEPERKRLVTVHRVPARPCCS